MYKVSIVMHSVASYDPFINFGLLVAVSVKGENVCGVSRSIEVSGSSRDEETLQRC